MSVIELCCSLKLVNSSLREVFTSRFGCFPRRETVAKSKVFSERMKFCGVRCQGGEGEKFTLKLCEQSLRVYLENDNSTKQKLLLSE